MSWFFSRRKSEDVPEPGKLTSGVHRSPGLELICQRHARHKARAILDLGPSSSKNLDFLSQRAANVMVQDAFHSAGENDGSRAERFTFADAAAVSLPDQAEGLETVLLWDLLHYLRPEHRPDLAARLAGLCAEDALVLVMASATSPIPPTPIQFKIEAEDRLLYTMEPERVASPGLHTRDVERAFRGFVPVRVFQLRNGLQELVLQRQSSQATDSTGAVAPLL